jgi:PAS domain S-box-containing protein
MLYPPGLTSDSGPLRNADADKQLLGIVLHQDGVVIDVDDETAAIFGCARGELIGRLVADLIVPNLTANTPTAANAVSSSGEQVPIEILGAPSPRRNEQMPRTL